MANSFYDIKKEITTFLSQVDDDFKQAHLTEEDLREKELCEQSLYEFVKRAWVAMYGSSFIDGWHIEVICAHLEALYDLEITDLIINQPFRTGKSMIGAVFFPAWGFTQDPGESFLFTSYSQKFAIRDSIATRRLIESDWYQKLWGKEVILRRDVNNKVQFETTANGFRAASSVNSGNTGGGANIICLKFDTLICTNKGQLEIGKIVENKLDVEVLSYNHETKECEYKSILDYIKNPGKELLEIDFGDGIIQCTAEHPIYVERKGYIRADELMEGDVVISL